MQVLIVIFLNGKKQTKYQFLEFATKVSNFRHVCFFLTKNLCQLEIGVLEKKSSKIQLYKTYIRIVIFKQYGSVFFNKLLYINH